MHARQARGTNPWSLPVRALFEDMQCLRDDSRRLIDGWGNMAAELMTRAKRDKKQVIRVVNGRVTVCILEKCILTRTAMIIFGQLARGGIHNAAAGHHTYRSFTATNNV